MDFLEKFSVKPPVSNFTQICPVGAALIHAGRWMDGQMYRQMDRRKRWFRNYTATPKN